IPQVPGAAPSSVSWGPGVLLDAIERAEQVLLRSDCAMLKVRTHAEETHMYSRIKLFGHPIHAMLVGFPVTLYTAALVTYVIAQASGDAFWFRMGIAANVAGVVMALVTAIPGFLDWLLGIPTASPAKGTGLAHMLLNVSA